MSIARICALTILVASSASIEATEDYVLPDDVTVLTEAEILSRIVGNTESGDYDDRTTWTHYYAPGEGKQGRVLGNGARGRFSGTWRVEGPLLCIDLQYADQPPYHKCGTVALEGETMTWYMTIGMPDVENKLTPGNPEGFR